MNELLEKNQETKEDNIRFFLALICLEQIQKWSPTARDFEKRLHQQEKINQQHFVDILRQFRLRDEKMSAQLERLEQQLILLTKTLEANNKALKPHSIEQSNEASLTKLATQISRKIPSSDQESMISLSEFSLDTQFCSDDNMQSQIETVAPNDFSEPPETQNFVEDTKNISKEADLYKKAQIEFKSKKYNIAEHLLREAIVIDESRADFLLLLAETLHNNPKYDKKSSYPIIKALFERSIQLDKKTSLTHRSYNILYSIVNNR